MLSVPESSPIREQALAGDLLEAARTVVRATARATGPGERRDLTGAQMDLLLQVRSTPGATVADIAQQLRLARNTVSTLVGQLTRAGLLERVPDPDDGRIARLRLHPAAERRMSTWRARRLGVMAAALAELGPDELAALGAALDPLQRLGRVLAGQVADQLPPEPSGKGEVR